jgi:hypothetical protein
MRRNNTQNNTKTENTQNRKQNIQNKKTNIKRITKKHETSNWNITKSKTHKTNKNQTTSYTIIHIQTA